MPATLKDCFHSRGARPALRQGVCASLLLASTAGSTSEILEYRCSPDIKHECTASGCETISSESGFPQAESFVYNPETGELSACLWTNCYAGSATVFAATNMDTFAVVGRLLPVRAGNEPVDQCGCRDRTSGTATGHRSLVPHAPPPERSADEIPLSH